MSAMRNDDDDLRARFRSLATDEAPAAPVYSRTQVDARRAVLRARRVRTVWYSAGGVAVAAAAAIAAFVMRPPAPPFPLDLSTTMWIAPTDFLLNTPGSSMLRDIPVIGLDNRTQSTNAAVRNGDDTSGGNE